MNVNAPYRARFAARLFSCYNAKTSQGFFWIATSHKMQGEWAQAGTQLSLSTHGVWVRLCIHVCSAMCRDCSRQVAALREMDVTAEEGPEADAEKEVRMIGLDDAHSKFSCISRVNR